MSEDYLSRHLLLYPCVHQTTIIDEVNTSTPPCCKTTANHHAHLAPTQPARLPCLVIPGLPVASATDAMPPARHHLRMARRNCAERRPTAAAEARRAAIAGPNVAPALSLWHAGPPRAAVEKSRLLPTSKWAARSLLLTSLASCGSASPAFHAGTYEDFTRESRMTEYGIVMLAARSLV